MEWVVSGANEPRSCRVSTVLEGESVQVELDGEQKRVMILGLDARTLTLELSGRCHRIPYHVDRGGQIQLSLGGRGIGLSVQSWFEHRVDLLKGAVRAGGFEPRVEAHMPGKIVAVPISVGEIVDEGTVLIVLEAMKMENAIKAVAPAKVAAVHVQVGASVEAGALLMELEESKVSDAGLPGEVQI